MLLYPPVRNECIEMRLRVLSYRKEISAFPDARVVSTLQDALLLLNGKEFEGVLDKVFVIGGSRVYSEAIKLPQCEEIFLTRIKSPNFEDCDSFVQPIDFNFYETLVLQGDMTENGITYDIVKLTKKNMEEKQYLDLIADIIATGNIRSDRTNTGTISKFGHSMKFSLRDGRFPLLTTKQVFWRGVAEELIWFISGKTNAKILKDKNIHIWDGNASREYLDSIGLKDRQENDLGPVYGFQWRHFGAKYVDMHSDYSGQGFDQLAHVIQTIKTNPNDRRIVLSAWNPADLKLMALPPCHMFCQFYVANGELSCSMYQRSCDMGLGVPFNIASYSLLTCMIASVCNLKPGDFTHMLGDAHVYLNHIEPLKEQLSREPYRFPTLKIKRAVDNIEDFTFEDFELSNYVSHKKIEMKMAV